MFVLFLTIIVVNLVAKGMKCSNEKKKADIMIPGTGAAD
jgi:hypothetical protein